MKRHYSSSAEECNERTAKREKKELCNTFYSVMIPYKIGDKVTEKGMQRVVELNSILLPDGHGILYCDTSVVQASWKDDKINGEYIRVDTNKHVIVDICQI